MHVGIDQTWQNIQSISINSLPRLVFADAENPAAADGKRPFDNLTREDVDDPAVGDKQIRRFPTGGHIDERGQ
jgi:hypothetical protein